MTLVAKCSAGLPPDSRRVACSTCSIAPSDLLATPEWASPSASFKSYWDELSSEPSDTYKPIPYRKRRTAASWAARLRTMSQSLSPPDDDSRFSLFSSIPTGKRQRCASDSSATTVASFLWPSTDDPLKSAQSSSSQATDYVSFPSLDEED